MQSTRRSFLKKAAFAGAAPFLLPARIWAAETKPNEQIGMGFIGMGKQSRGLLGNFLGQGVKVLGVCDVDTTRREHHKKKAEDYYSAKGETTYKGCAEYKEFQDVIARKDIDAVLIGAPDHWHVPLTIDACRAGKDVYVEKLKEESGVSNKKRKKQAVVMRKLDRFYENHTFSNEEISNIFDLIDTGE